MKKQLLIVLSAIFLCIMATACNSRGNMYSTKTKFPWTPNISAPRNYPAEVKYAYLGFGTEGEKYPVMSSFTEAGIGISKGDVSFETYEDDEGLDVPNSLDALWLSCTEGKFYKVHADFSQELQKKMLNLLQEGYYNSYYDGDEKKLERKTYSVFLMTMLPGGKVWLYMEGLGKCVLVCDTIQGEPVEMTLEEFDKDAPNVANTVKEYSEGNLRKEQIENLKVNGIPFGVWDRYRERFNYDIKFEFEDERSRIDSLSVVYKFINGEFYYTRDGAKTGALSRPKKLYLKWNVGDINYTGEFFLDEQEILENFSKIFGGNARQTKGTFIVRVSKYNNKFDIYLQTKDNKIYFRKTKIDVFRITQENKDADDHLFYWNYQDEEVQPYIGE